MVGHKRINLNESNQGRRMSPRNFNTMTKPTTQSISQIAAAELIIRNIWDCTLMNRAEKKSFWALINERYHSQFKQQ
jgi:hypothetical protein